MVLSIDDVRATEVVICVSLSTGDSIKHTRACNNGDDVHRALANLNRSDMSDPLMAVNRDARSICAPMRVCTRYVDWPPTLYRLKLHKVHVDALHAWLLDSDTVDGDPSSLALDVRDLRRIAAGCAEARPSHHNLTAVYFAEHRLAHMRESRTRIDPARSRPQVAFDWIV